MISAWDVYWVMQLDSIGMGLVLLGSGLVVVAGVVGVAIRDHEERISVIAALTVAFGMSLWVVNMFLPSSKTAAAMLLIPALTSEQVTEPLTAEARELYGLAKKALTDLAEKRSAPEPEKK